MENLRMTQIHVPKTQIAPVWIAIIFLTTLVLPSCTTGENIRMSMRGGETREEVERMLGRPDGYQRQSNTEALIYSNRLITGWGWDRADYIVVLTDGRVSSYGPGAVRQGQGPALGTLVIIPFR
jgi:hypothetical protein